MTGLLATALLRDVLSVLGLYSLAALAVLLGLFGALYRRILVNATFDDLDSTAHEELVNCPSCGARSTPEPAACDYCGEPLFDDEPPEYGWADE